jgi:hypothetical protein
MSQFNALVNDELLKYTPKAATKPSLHSKFEFIKKFYDIIAQG